MVAKKSKDAPGTPTSDEKPAGFEQFAFLNFDLNKEQKDALKAMPLWNAEWDDMLGNATKAGFNISLKVDGFNHCFAAYMQIRLRSHPCYGFILSGRGSTQTKALRQLLYKHFVALEENWNAVAGAAIVEYDD